VAVGGVDCCGHTNVVEHSPNGFIGSTNFVLDTSMPRDKGQGWLVLEQQQASGIGQASSDEFDVYACACECSHTCACTFVLRVDLSMFQHTHTTHTTD
jgi:hypothetical protein